MSLLKHHITVKSNQIFVIETIPDIPSTSPTVVLVPGLGGTALGWCAVQRLIPSGLRSFSYDRLGLNHSDRTELPRPASILAQELKDTLVAAGAPSPYLLVASSYAGIICREFLEKFDSDIAGLIYVDANQEKTQMERQWPLEATGRMVTSAFSTDDASGLSQAHKCTEEEWKEIKAEEKMRKEERERDQEKIEKKASGEWITYESSLLALGEHKQLERQALGSRPLSVIMANLTRDFQRLFDAGKAAGLGTPEDHALVDDFCARLPAVELKLNNEVLKLSSLHRMIVTSISGHLVALWEPELCVQEIMWCLGHCDKQ